MGILYEAETHTYILHLIDETTFDWKNVFNMIKIYTFQLTEWKVYAYDEKLTTKQMVLQASFLHELVYKQPLFTFDAISNQLH